MGGARVLWGLAFCTLPLAGLAQSIQGTVTRSADGMPVAGALVRAFPPDPFPFIPTTFTAADGTYSLAAPVLPGPYTVFAAGEGLAGELYDNVPCNAVACDVKLATPVFVPPAGVTGISFALDAAGSIEGTVRRSGDNAPMEGVNVLAYTLDDAPAGAAMTAADGTYRLFVPPGGVRVFTANAQQRIDQLHPAIPCPFMRCDRAGATTFDIANGQVQAGVDFTLAAGGVVAGQV